MNKRIKIKLGKYPKGKKFWLFNMKGNRKKVSTQILPRPIVRIVSDIDRNPRS